MVWDTDTLIADRDATVERLVVDESEDGLDELRGRHADSVEDTAEDTAEDEETETPVDAVEVEEDAEEATEVGPTDEDVHGALDALSAYFADVGNGRLLTFDEELTLGRAVQAGMAAHERL